LKWQEKGVAGGNGLRRDLKVFPAELGVAGEVTDRLWEGFVVGGFGGES